MIKFENVSFSYDASDKVDIKNIQMEIEEGEFILLTGKSGCGKSTILNMINGIIPQHIEGSFSGKIFLDHEEIEEKSVQEIGIKVGSVFQNPKSQFFHLNTTDEILFSASNKGMEKEEMLQRLEETKELFQLEKLLGRDIFNMSGGEKQKIACASVFAGKPRYLVFDEPSANLDKANIHILMDILKKLKGKGYTIVVAEHRLYYLMDLCDRVIYIKDGQIEKEYSRQEFLAIEDHERHNLGLRSMAAPTIEKEIIKPIKGELQIDSLTFSYGAKKILNIEKLGFKSNEIVGIIGHNGCGKSTFAHLLVGLKKTKSICFQGEALKDKQRQKKFNLVMQDVNHQLFTESVFDEIALDAPKLSEEEREQILRELELLELRERHPLSLSGGQKQRLSLASCIASNREVIVLDEPTSGLDYNHMIKVSKMLTQLKEKHLIIIVITHDYEFINACCDTVMDLSS